jgi:hypothetical protein
MTPRKPATDHVWVGAAILDFTAEQARAAAVATRHGHPFRLAEPLDAPLAEVYCSGCRRARADVDGQPCIVGGDTAHLIGGPADGQRRPRTHTHDCRAYGCSGTGVPQATVDAVARQWRRGHRRAAG